MVTTTWHMLTGPARHAGADIVGMLNREVTTIVERPQMRKHFEIDAVETMALTAPPNFTAIRTPGIREMGAGSHEVAAKVE